MKQVIIFLFMFFLVLMNNKILNSILGRIILLSALVICTMYSRLLGLVLVIILTVVYSSSMIWSNSYMTEGMCNHNKREGAAAGAGAAGAGAAGAGAGAAGAGAYKGKGLLKVIKDKLDMEHYFRPKRHFHHTYKKYDVAVPYRDEPIYYSRI